MQIAFSNSGEMQFALVSTEEAGSFFMRITVGNTEINSNTVISKTERTSPEVERSLRIPDIYVTRENTLVRNSSV